MSDNYISLDECGIYGPYTTRKIHSMVLGSIESFDGALNYVSNLLDTHTTNVAQAVDNSRTAKTAVREGVVMKGTALDDGEDVLRRFSKYLASQKKGAVDRKVYFVADGTVKTAMKGGQHKVVDAMKHVAKELKKKDNPLDEAKAWSKQFTEALAALSPVVDSTDEARAQQQNMTPEVAKARDTWLVTYGATKSLVECVLRLQGKLDQMPLVFNDLAVRGTTGAAEEDEPTGGATTTTTATVTDAAAPAAPAKKVVAAKRRHRRG